MKIAILNIENDIPLETARRAFDGISFSPEKRGDRVKADYEATILSLADFIESAAKDERQQAIAQEVFDRLRNKFRDKYLSWLGAKSRCISTMITGPANFPVRRAEKANMSEERRLAELIAFEKVMRRYAEKSFEKAIPKEERKESELEGLRAKLAQAEKYQAFMKAANAAERKKDEAGLIKLFGEYFGGDGSIPLAKFRKVNYMGRVGFETWQLSNNLANIKRMKERVGILEAKKEKAATGEDEVRELNGARVLKNYQQDRLQIIFYGKPDENTRTLLKRHGFKWSPNNSAWQRQLTPNAVWTLKHYVFPAEAFAQYMGEA